jgi:TfoX/Sxy family transcriptional regulator of competence genes
MTVEERFERLVDELVGIEGVGPPSPGRGFGSSALKYHGKIFAMLVRGHLVVKLTKARVAELVAAGEGRHFDANKGIPMKEWFTLGEPAGLAWSALAREALELARDKETKV